MSKWGQVGVILAIVVSMACIALGVLYFQENEKRLSLERNLEQVLEKKRIVEGALSQKEQIISKLRQSMDEMDLEFNLKLEQESIKLANLSQELKDLKEEKGNLKNDYSKLKDMRNLLKKKLKQVQVEKKKLEANLVKLRKKYDILVAKFNYSDEDKTELSLEKIVVQQNPVWQGEILAVDNEYGYAVISLGIKKSLPENLSLNIFHNRENIGQAKILKLYENTSVIKIIDQSKEILEGDSVRNVN